MSLLLGAIADDFTGATDLANTLVGAGMRAVQLIGVPGDDVDTGDAEAVIIALKSRTAPVEQAVAESLAALDWHLARGAEQIFFKYCSTFDSTAKGNIGPVADALMTATGSDIAIVCPAFPATGRTIYQGHLFVGSELLSDSPMKDHPLTPMRHASLPRLLAPQTTRGVGLVAHQTIAQGPDAVRRALQRLRADGVAYAVTDAVADADLAVIGAAAVDHGLVTGGSGVALGLPENFRAQGLLGEAAPPRLPECQGPSAVLAGSCSTATRAQIAFAARDWPSYRIDIRRIAAGEKVADQAVTWAAAQPADRPVVIYGSSGPEEIATIHEELGRERSSEMMERCLGTISRGLVAGGTRRLIVAGGETAGAVVTALGIKGLRIGPEIDPGVPWTETLGEPRLALALKSGNFGGEDFFAKALEMLP